MDTERLKAYLDDRFDAWVRDEDAGLTGFLRIPSISGDPDHVADVRRSAEWLVEAFRRSGFPTVEVWETGGLPAVFAEWPSDDPAAPVAVVYGHHDVQPVDPLELWETPPFEPTIRGDELFARGAIDDKGQVLFHLLGLDAWLATSGKSAPPVTLKFLVEGEEESGSPNFAELLRRERERLRCDVVVVSDTGIFDRDTPTICTGMRGLIGATIDLHGPDIDLHSGSFGGAVPNPLTVLARLLGRLHDDAGRVTLPGFYDPVVPLSDRERQLIAKLPFDEDRFLRTAQSRAAAGEDGYSTLERLWARPTAEVNGMWGGYMGPGGKTIVPSDAHAKVSFRLVSNQEPARVREQFEQFVADNVPAGIEVSMTWESDGVRPCLTPLDDPALQAATRAMERAFGTEVLYMREGGSGPEADLADILAAPVVFVGVGLPDDRIHAPNERVVLPMLRTGAEVAAYLWDELAGSLRH
jgi:acetylornithine deacetylase/succinyl-diaminopimelate desuccinylase-like protein